MSSSGIVLVSLVAFVVALGFAASAWGRRASLTVHEEWALAGRRFGTVVSWFLIGGDLYTASTFIALPALVYGSGAIAFFSMPFAAIVYPIAFVIMVRFWKIARHRGYVTAADFVRDRFRDRWLEVAIAATGVVAVMPYVALQLVGMKTIFLQLGGIFSAGSGLAALTVAFVLLGAYTYTSGLRAAAAIAFVKDALIYVTVIAAIVVIPAKLGGWSHVFSAAAAGLAARAKPASIYLAPSQYFTFVTMALGSALALFLYPHSITSVLSVKSAKTIRRNAMLLPIYSILLGFLSLLGYTAIAAGIHTHDPNRVVPLLFERFFPSWFAGVAYAAVAIGALVPATIMCIGAANLFASNIFRHFEHERHPIDALAAKRLTMGMCVAALLFVVFVPVPYALDFQLIGNAIVLQTFPSLVFGLWSRWFAPKALLAGWACGVVTSCAMTVGAGFTATFPLVVAGRTFDGYVALYGLAVNLVVAAIASGALRVYRGRMAAAQAPAAGEYV